MSCYITSYIIPNIGDQRAYYLDGTQSRSSSQSPATSKQYRPFLLPSNIFSTSFPLYLLTKSMKVLCLWFTFPHLRQTLVTRRLLWTLFYPNPFPIAPYLYIRDQSFQIGKSNKLQPGNKPSAKCAQLT